MISCDLINKSDNSSGFISGFFRLPGLATWAARPGPNSLTPSPAQPDPIQARAGPISPGPIARLIGNCSHVHSCALVSLLLRDPLSPLNTTFPLLLLLGFSPLVLSLNLSLLSIKQYKLFALFRDRTSPELLILLASLARYISTLFYMPHNY